MLVTTSPGFVALPEGKHEFRAEDAGDLFPRDFRDIVGRDRRRRGASLQRGQNANQIPGRPRLALTHNLAHEVVFDLHHVVDQQHLHVGL